MGKVRVGRGVREEREGTEERGEKKWEDTRTLRKAGRGYS